MRYVNNYTIIWKIISEDYLKLLKIIGMKLIENLADMLRLIFTIIG